MPRDRDLAAGAERVARNARTLRRLYPELFEAAARGQGRRERESGRNRADPPGPVDEGVLDLIREVNAAALELQTVVQNAMGMHPAGPADVRYRQSPKVAEALQFLERAAASIERLDLDGYVGDWLAELNRQARRKLGITSRRVALGVACPVQASGERCGGTLFGLPSAGLVVCDRCDTTWRHTDWEALGRTVRILQRAA